MIQSVVGGTLSQLTGGKFANGAMTSVVQYLVNEVGDSISQAQQRRARARQLAEVARGKEKYGIGSYMKKQKGFLTIKSPGKDLISGEATLAEMAVGHNLGPFSLEVSYDSHWIGKFTAGLGASFGNADFVSIASGAKLDSTGIGTIDAEVCSYNYCQQPYAQVPVIEVIYYEMQSVSYWFREMAYSGR